MPPQDTKNLILDTAQDLIFARGYAGVSFRDIASVIGVKSASIHYHYPCKTDLARALLDRSLSHTCASLDSLNRFIADPHMRLNRLCETLQQSLQAPSPLLLPFLLLAEATALDPSLLPLLQSHTTLLESWLTDLLTEASQQQTLATRSPIPTTTQLILHTLHGALLHSRAQHTPTLFTATATTLRRLIQV